MSKTVIEAWVLDLTFPGYMDQWYKLAADFEARHPEYEVRIEAQDFRLLPQHLATSIAEGHVPTIAEYYFYMLPTARDMRTPDGRPAFTSVQQAVGGRADVLGEPVVLDDIFPAFRDFYSYQGDLTAMPSVITTSLIFGNAELLRATGITELPRTWDEVTEACRTIAASPARPAYPLTFANHGTFIQQAIYSQGGVLADNDNGRSARATSVDLATPQMLANAAWWKQLHDEGTFRAFATGEVALRISSSNDVNYMVEAAKANGFELAVGIMPFNSAVPYGGNAIAGSSLCLADGLDEATRDGAVAFLQFAHNPRNAANRHVHNSFIPLTRSSYDLLDREGWFDQHPYHRVASVHIDEYPQGAIVPDGVDPAGAPPSLGALFGDFAGNQDVMTKAVHDVLTTDVDPVARFAEATVEAQQLLDEYEADAASPTGPSRPESLRVEYFRDAEWYSGADLENVVQLQR
jgi:sn-glycerol 3-phosphate transport system substrate-binding protein